MISEETKELRKRTLEILYKAYVEQSDAAKSINSRMSFLAATISLLLTAITTIFKIIIDTKIEIVISAIFFVVIGIFLLIALINCLWISFLTSGKGFPIDELIEPAEGINDFEKFYEEEKGLLVDIGKDTRDINFKRSKYLNFSIKLVIVSIVLLLIGGFIILVVHNI